MSDTEILLDHDSGAGYSSIIKDANDIPHKWSSIRVVYAVMFFTSISYSIQMPSLWPYMTTIDKSYTKDFLGWVVAAYSIGQLFTCPIFSYVSGCTGRFKMVLIFSSLLAIGGNYMYSIIVDINGPLERKVSLLASRIIIGISGANIAAIRLFLTLATTEKERIGPMSTLSACQAIGFIMGPGIQAALVPLGYPGVIETPFFRVNMYTTSGLFSVLTSLLILVLTCCFFKEDFLKDIHEPDLTSTMDSSDGVSKGSHQFFNDYLSALFMILAFFVCMGTLAVMETSITPITMDNFAWSKSQATLINSIILACVGVCSVAVLFSIRVLTKKIKERILLIVAFLLCLGAVVLLIPMGKGKIPLVHSDVTPVDSNSTFNNSSGCNVLIQEWCKFVPVLEMWQFACSLVLLTLGYPAANVLSYVIFSRLVNPAAQSLWMGLLTASGSLARIVGPIFISKLYVEFGTQVAFGSWGGVILLFICLTPLFTVRMRKIERRKSLYVNQCTDGQP